jgi:hypothetical protein
MASPGNIDHAFMETATSATSDCLSTVFPVAACVAAGRLNLEERRCAQAIRAKPNSHNLDHGITRNGVLNAVILFCLRLFSQTDSTSASNWRNESETVQTDVKSYREDATRLRGIRWSCTADSSDVSTVVGEGNGSSSRLRYPLRLFLTRKQRESHYNPLSQPLPEFESSQERKALMLPEVSHRSNL